MFYVPAAQANQKMVNLANMWFQPSWIVRTGGPIGDLTGKMQQALAGAAPGCRFGVLFDGGCAAPAVTNAAH